LHAGLSATIRFRALPAEQHQWLARATARQVRKLGLVLRKELADRLAAQGRTPPEWNRLVTDLADLSTVEVEQDGRRALLRTAPGPTIDPVCRALGLVLPAVFQEMPPAPAAA
jgi:hypothetical protein